MHGRLKVRTTEDERKRKKKEQLLKVKAYKVSMKIILDKRRRNEYDDEMMEVTRLLLLRAPDIVTLWNVRKECILQKLNIFMAKNLENNSNGEEVKSMTQEIQKVFDEELSFTEQCLPANPKSYCTWHQRCWLMENGPYVNWIREVMLCKKYLSLDERNFHTWDYFRYTVSKAKIDKHQMLEFSTEQIKINFSNYSSWHHRSLLLPTLYPCNLEGDVNCPMEESKLREELETVLTAVFTDPNDSSAWFYQRWLLSYSKPKITLCAFRTNKEKAVLTFTRSIHHNGIKVILKGDESSYELNDWLAINKTPVDCAFFTFHPLKENLLHCKYIQIFTSHYVSDILPLKSNAQNIYYVQSMTTSTLYAPGILKHLSCYLDSCENLLKYEPDSKWTLLTSALLMRAIDYKTYHKKIVEYLQKLQIVDPLRINYYKDIISKWKMENILIDWSFSKEISLRLNLFDVEELTTIPYPQYTCIMDEIFINEKLKLRNPKLLTFQNI